MPSTAMPSITALPYEIVAEILKNLDHLRSLGPAVLACRHFYASFKASHGVDAAILRRQIPSSLLPYAVAVMEAARLPRPLLAVSVVSLLDELDSKPTHLAARLSTLPTSLLWKMGRTHDAIHAMASDFAARALKGISRRSASASTALSPSEWFRFRRALYRVELFYSIFRDGAIETRVMTNPWFFARYSPWEIEQMSCVCEYLEARFAEASFDVVAHDVEFGALSIDYLNVRDDNYRRQRWLSNGVEFVYKLTIADSYDVQYSMLRSTLEVEGGRVNLAESLREILGDIDGRPLEEISQEELLDHVERPSDHVEDDADPGPYEAWRRGNAHSTLEETLMFPETAWLRERAYVLWDGARVQEQGESIFGDAPPEYQDVYTRQESKEMHESFAERSKIWQKGGRGYWTRGDTSRIVWPESDY